MEHLLSILSWIIVGGLSGWMIGLPRGRTCPQHWRENMLVGMIEAFVGRFSFALLTGLPTAVDWNVGSLALEIIGVQELLIVLQLSRR